MKGYGEKFLSELKNKNDIASVVSKYVRLEQRGGNLWGKCPFHHEKTASFCVNTAGQFFYCFGCHKSGDVITFVREMESLDFQDAVRLLAERAHIPLPDVQYDDSQLREQKKRKERILALLKDAARFYAANLRSEGAEKHIEYILKRKITSEYVAKFGLGASLDYYGLPRHLSKLGYTLREMVDSGAVGERGGKPYDALGGRPGIHTARYGCTPSHKLTSQEQYSLLLKEMEGQSARSARFVSACVLMLSPERIFIAQETVEGRIAHEARGSHGFGYDPIFLVGDGELSMAELSDSQKDSLSHRGRAMRRLNAVIEEIESEEE